MSRRTAQKKNRKEVWQFEKFVTEGIEKAMLDEVFFGGSEVCSFAVCSQLSLLKRSTRS